MRRRLAGTRAAEAEAEAKTPLAATYGTIAEDITLARAPLDAFVKDALGCSVSTRHNFWSNFEGTPILVSAGGVVTFNFPDLQDASFINSGVASNMGEKGAGGSIGTARCDIYCQFPLGTAVTCRR